VAYIYFIKLKNECLKEYVKMSVVSLSCGKNSYKNGLLLKYLQII